MHRLMDFSAPAIDPEPKPKFGALGEMIASKTFNAIYAPIPGAGMGEFRKVLTEACLLYTSPSPRD